MRETCVASTLQAQMALAWGGVIEYKSIPGALRPSTISLSFWLSWSFDMVSRASVTKRSRVRISSTPHFSAKYLAQGMREICAASTLQAQRDLAWGGVIEYKSIPGAELVPWQVVYGVKTKYCLHDIVKFSWHARCNCK